MPSHRRLNSVPTGKDNEEEKRKLKKKLKRDKTVLEKRIAEQTNEFEAERRLTEKRLKKWMDPNNGEVFEQRLRRHVEREAKNLDNRVSHKLKSVVKERRYLQSRIVMFRKQQNLDDLLKQLQCDTESKKKQRRTSGVG